MDALHIAANTRHHGRRSAAARQAVVRDLPARPANLGLCPTCLACDGDAVDMMPGASHPGVALATCPTCGVASIEYGLTLAIDDMLGEMSGLAAVEVAVGAE